MKHPRAEIYASVEPAFAARGCGGFADGLVALTEAVVGNAAAEQVTATYDDLLEDIAACEAVAAATDPAVVTDVIRQLLQNAAVEYRIGVIDGAINNLHEYQDAWGFTRVAGQWAQSDAFSANPDAGAVAVRLQDLIAGLDNLWPSLDPSGSVEGEAAQLFGAAGQAEIIGLALPR